MKIRIRLGVLATLAILLSPAPLRSQGTTFTYQAQLLENGLPISGAFTGACDRNLNEKVDAETAPLRTENAALKTRLEKLEQLFAHSLNGGAK